MDGLEKILDKLGIFSILAVFVPGLAIGTDAYLLCEIAEIKIGSFSEMGLVFIIVSFLLGIVFYEIGYTLFAFTKIQDKILFNVVRGKYIFLRSPHLKLCDYEYKKVKEYINMKCNNATNNKQNPKDENNDIDNCSDANWDGYRVYNYCKYRVNEHRDNNSIVAMSRTLFIYFFCISVVTAILTKKNSCKMAGNSI